MEDYQELSEFMQELDEELKDPFRRIMVTLNIAAMMSPFTLEPDELETLAADVYALRDERDARPNLEADAVAGLVEAAKEALALLDDTRDTAARFKAHAILADALEAMSDDRT